MSGPVWKGGERGPEGAPLRAELRVSLLQHTPDPDRAVAIAGRLCYAPVSAAELQEQMGDDDVAKLVRILVRSGHHSALEHAAFSFAVDGVSRACTHQLVRHRVASYNQQSQRYVNFGAADSFIVPPSIAANPAAEAVFLKAMQAAREAYDELVELGLAEGRTRESVQEDARFVLPGAAETKIVVTMNARELRHFFQVRCCNRAQWEIRELAWRMRGMVKDLAPNLFAGSGPGCLYGSCPEGKMTCGRPYRPEDVDGPAGGGPA